MAGYGEWNESLFGCFDDIGSCCYGYWCTPCLFGSNAEKIDGSSCCGMCCIYSILASCAICWVPHMMKRGDLRRKYNLREEPCGDCPTTLCCGPCALCQEARLLKRRGGQPGVIIGYAQQGGVVGYGQQGPVVGYAQQGPVGGYGQPGPMIMNQPRNQY